MIQIIQYSKMCLKHIYNLQTKILSLIYFNIIYCKFLTVLKNKFSENLKQKYNKIYRFLFLCVYK